jgi:hypothetical protein
VLVSRSTGNLKFGVQTFVDFFRDLETASPDETESAPGTKGDQRGTGREQGAVESG